MRQRTQSDLWLESQMCLPHPFSDSAIRRNPPMKGLSRIVIGSAAGGLLVAEAFFAESVYGLQLGGGRRLLTFAATRKRTLNRTWMVGRPPVETRSSGIERNCSIPVTTMNTDLIKCQCNTDCQCSVEVSKSVMRDGKAFCCEPCADGLICGCH